MPYVPSKKTDGNSTDRELIDQAVGRVVEELVPMITNNLSLINVYRHVFMRIATYFTSSETPMIDVEYVERVRNLAWTIYEVGEKYGYEGAFLGELNYAITRLIQHLPRAMVNCGKWKEELRYWLYAATVEALTWTAYETRNFGIGISGVFEDVKDEYKRRVNSSYEAAQILKSGDCYDTPYYNRLVEVRDSRGNHIGHLLVDVKSSADTLDKDILDGHFVLHK